MKVRQTWTTQSTAKLVISFMSLNSYPTTDLSWNTPLNFSSYQPIYLSIYLSLRYSLPSVLALHDRKRETMKRYRMPLFPHGDAWCPDNTTPLRQTQTTTLTHHNTQRSKPFTTTFTYSLKNNNVKKMSRQVPLIRNFLSQTLTDK